MSEYRVTMWRDRHGQPWTETSSGGWSTDGGDRVYDTWAEMFVAEGQMTPADVDNTDALLADHLALVDGWRALLQVEAHDLEQCPDCRRYVAAILRGTGPRRADGLRCGPARQWQRAINAAHEVVESGQRQTVELVVEA